MLRFAMCLSAAPRRMPLWRAGAWLVLLGATCAQLPAVAQPAAPAVDAAQVAAPQEEVLVCPVNGQTFAYRIDRFSAAKGYALDMQPYGAPDLPWPLPECPGNGFVLYKQQFTSAEVQRLKPVLEQAGFAAKPVHERAFLLARGLKEPLPLQLRLLQLAAWRGGAIQGDTYRGQALPLLALLLADKTLSARSQLDYVMLQAEYQRRLGRFEAANASASLAANMDPETLKPLLPILQCQQDLIAQKSRRASPIPGDNARCGDRID